VSSSSTCTGITGCTPGTPSGLALAPGSYGNVHLTGQGIIHLSTGTYTINSIDLTGNSKVVIDSGPVVLNVAGQGVTTPVDFTGGSLTNSSLDPSKLQIQYAGTGTIKLEGGSQASGLVYAPNAPVQFGGGTDWFGAVISKTASIAGGMKIHNDRQLANEFFTVGNYMLSAFSWKKF